MKYLARFYREATAIVAMACLTIGAAAANDVSPSRNTDWAPEKPVTFIVPSNPGGGWDQTARFFQQAVIENDYLPVSIEVVNRGGGGGTIALSELVKTYHGDSHKLMMTGFGMVGSALMHESEYSLLDVTPIARLTGEYQVIAVSKDSPHQTLESLMATFKADPKAISWAGGSAGGSDQIFIVQVAEAIGISPDNVNYVAFTGGGEANAALMGNQVTAAITGYGEIKGLVESGRVNLLAISSETRVVNDSLPTFIEKGINVTFQNWRGIVAPPGISVDQQKYYAHLATQVRNSDYWQTVLDRNDWQDSFMIDPQLGGFFAENKTKTAKTLASMGVGKSSETSAIGPYFFPKIVGLGLLLSGLALVLGRYRAVTSGASSANNDEAPDGDVQKWSGFAFTLGLAVLYVVGLSLTNFLIATPIFIVALSRVIGSKSLVRDIIVAVVLTGIVFLLFDQFLNVSLP